MRGRFAERGLFLLARKEPNQVAELVGCASRPVRFLDAPQCGVEDTQRPTPVEDLLGVERPPRRGEGPSIGVGHVIFERDVLKITASIPRTFLAIVRCEVPKTDPQVGPEATLLGSTLHEEVPGEKTRKLAMDEIARVVRSRRHTPGISVHWLQVDLAESL